MEWRSQRGSVRTRCGPPIPFYLGMKVCGLVVQYLNDYFTFMAWCTLHMHVIRSDCTELRGKFPFKEGRM